MSERRIEIAKQFSRYPGGRYRRDGAHSGEAFREDVLLPALKEAVKSGTRLVVVLDGTEGYPSSFLEEAFGGLIREHDLDPELLETLLVIEADDPVYAPYEGLSRRYMKDAQSSLAKH